MKNYIERDTKSEKESILIVENNCEALYRLGNELETTYNIWQAKDDRKALEIVKEREINLILTDVMIPAMTGLQLCKQIKQNVRTCHIPVIIFSTNADLKEQLKGLQAGADDYISNPFTTVLVKTKIRNILLTHNQIIQHSCKSLYTKQEKSPLNPTDEALLKRAKKIVENHLDDTEFSIEAFAREMCMSRSNLYRKIKSLEGETCIYFIRKIRLNRACNLLLKKENSITEISNMTGFSTLSFFSACFKKHYGCLPSNYVKIKQKQ
ncbi:DNA-binding response regulator [uncultured Bacteroides sp.]|uniref:response regulator transcription factor n=1 Tax=uncultured Bacteroides sp. TaxID=162156 RepID=UPI0025FA1F32|nr:DNA-binding response regulator [uncultured Bacteroides sp.]